MKVVKSRIAFPLIIVACVSASIVACSGGGGSGPHAPTVTPEATAAPPHGTPFPAPTVTGQVLTSTAKGYSVAFPDGWTIRSNYATVGNESLDVAFYGPDSQGTPTVATVRPSLAIGCLPVNTIPDRANFADQRAKALQATLSTPGEVKQRQIAGLPAVSVTYRRDIKKQTGGVDSIQQTDVFFVTDVCGFTISLLSAPEAAAGFAGPFDAMLSSFRLLNAG